MSFFETDVCRLCASQTKPNFEIFEQNSSTLERTKLSKMGDMMLDCLFAEVKIQ